jgi:SsrA-binding protein
MAGKKRKKFTEVSNKSATYHFEVKTKYIAGIVLQGTEVKSVKDAQISFNDSFCTFINKELFIKSLYIKEYKFGASNNHNPTQDRKLLLNKIELKKISEKVKEKGFTIIPLRIFMAENGLLKLEIALATGKKLYDKRNSIKERDTKRELERDR